MASLLPDFRPKKFPKIWRGNAVQERGSLNLRGLRCWSEDAQSSRQVSCSCVRDSYFCLLLIFVLDFVFFCWCCLLKTRSHNVSQADLQLPILLPQPSESWDYKFIPPCPAQVGSWLTKLKVRLREGWTKFLPRKQRFLAGWWGEEGTGWAETSENQTRSPHLTS